MNTFLITYDLVQPEQEYTELIAEIKKLGRCIKPLFSTWFVATTLDFEEVYNRLAPFLDENDKIIVAHVESPAIWNGFTSRQTVWIMKHF